MPFCSIRARAGACARLFLRADVSSFRGTSGRGGPCPPRGGWGACNGPGPEAKPQTPRRGGAKGRRAAPPQRRGGRKRGQGPKGRSGGGKRRPETGKPHPPPGRGEEPRGPLAGPDGPRTGHGPDERPARREAPRRAETARNVRRRNRAAMAPCGGGAWDILLLDTGTELRHA